MGIYSWVAVWNLNGWQLSSDQLHAGKFLSQQHIMLTKISRQLIDYFLILKLLLSRVFRCDIYLFYQRKKTFNDV